MALYPSGSPRGRLLADRADSAEDGNTLGHTVSSPIHGQNVFSVFKMFLKIQFVLTTFYLNINGKSESHSEAEGV